MGAHATFSVPPPNGEYQQLLLSNRHFDSPTGSSLPHLLLWAAQLTALLSPRFRGRGPLFATIIILLAVATHINPHFTNNARAAQPFVLAWANWMGVVEKLLFSGPDGPESSFWRVDRPAREAEAFPPFGWEKLRWACALMVNLRGVRWSHQVKNVPPLARQREEKGRFLRSQLVVLGYYFVMADVVNQAWIQLYYTTADGRVGEVNSKYLTLNDPDWRWRLVKTLAWGPLPYYMINFHYVFFSLPAVLLGISQPEDWPPLFGSLRKVTTVRRLWGEFWQQIVRRVFTQYSKALVDALRIPHGTHLSSYTQLWLSFAMSAFFHAQSNLISVGPGNITVGERTGGMFAFFLSQAAVITIEDFAQWVWTRRWLGGKSEGGSVLRVTVGWVWVCWCLWVSLPWAADVTLRLRFGDEPMLPFSVSRPLVECVFQVVRDYA